MPFLRTLLTVIAIAWGISASGADEIRNVDVRFTAGTSQAALTDAIVGYNSVLYRVGAEAGQTMRVTLSASNGATYFNVYAPGRGPGDEALATGQNTQPLNDWTGILPASGEYTVSVYMMRSAARRNERSDFTIDIAVDGATGGRVDGDFADGLSGGPDFYEVKVSGGGSLNMRVSASASAQVVTRLSNGQNVRNLGCRMSEGRRWCRIATLADPGFEGWASADFLVEGTGAEQPSRPTQSGAQPSSQGRSSGAEQRVRFAAGSTGVEMTGSLAPGETQRYVIGASSGQDLYVRVAPRGIPISYQIFNPDRTFLLDQITSDREYRGELWQSGDHVIEVINRTNGVAGYNIIIGIE
jgi:hypothetical protein